MACENFMKIKQFFCCCTLRTGCLIIGYLGLVYSILSTAAESGHYEYFQSMSFKNLNVTDTDFEDFYTQYMSMGIAYYVISIILNAILIWGIYKNNRQFVLPWLTIKGLELILSAIVAIILIIYFVFSLHFSLLALLLVTALFAVIMWLTLYFYMCVYSFYSELSPTSRSLETNEDFNTSPAYIQSFYDNKQGNFNDSNIKNV